MSELPTYKLDQTFDAPRDMVWRVWTDPDLLHRWYGPGIETIIHKFDLKPGGSWLNEMKWGGNSDFSRMDFVEVAAHEKLVWHHSSTDADWNIITSPMMADWPKVLLTTVIFEEIGDKTKLRFSQIPVEATEAEIVCFTTTMSGMDKGWGSGFTIISELLAELKADGAK